MKVLELISKTRDWLAIVVMGSALRCPRCGGAARNNASAPPGSFGAKTYICPACMYGFSKPETRS